MYWYSTQFLIERRGGSGREDNTDFLFERRVCPPSPSTFAIKARMTGGEISPLCGKKYVPKVQRGRQAQAEAETEESKGPEASLAGAAISSGVVPLAMGGFVQTRLPYSMRGLVPCQC